ncbi:hypothetical protein ADK65_14110 [Streptomyces sp. NRRL B-1140]|uniref:DUF6086 family protein n=1 Tax=Streptomyces sp. NRRL B-1140 TaxID=1415549 RepID=UPI0006AEB212|nr:DUF6086 family protein [Streptomyces sp. NRRL B-1140]KOX00746.1 hypothetical protein ADK65_14110 [Streptomyces sp. NRRL B-1140]
MSMYFDVGDETLWNPSNGAGRLFLRQLEVFEAELGMPSGVGHRHEGDPDTLEVDPAVYAAFVRRLVAWHGRTGHSVILALSEGFVATAVALAWRAGIEVELPPPGLGPVAGAVQPDVQVPGHPRPAPATRLTALDTRAREVDRWMPR